MSTPNQVSISEHFPTSRVRLHTLAVLDPIPVHPPGQHLLDHATVYLADTAPEADFTSVHLGPKAVVAARLEQMAP